MYGFIFYGVYKELNKTIVSTGKDKQIDRRISAVALTSLIMGTHIATFYAILKNRFKMDYLRLPEDEFTNYYIVFFALLIWLYNEIFHKRKLKELSLKYKPIYDKHKYLDMIVGTGVLVVSIIIFLIFGRP
jgi:hypothetical protein